jgi:hypothetical protein
MNFLKRVFGVRHPHYLDLKQFTEVVPLGRQRCPECGSDWQNIGFVSKSGKVQDLKAGSAAAGTIFSCEQCGSRWTAPAIAAGWHPRIRMTVFRREQKHPGSEEPEEVCEILSDGVDGLLKVKDAAEKDKLGEVFGIPHFRLTNGGQLPDGTMFDAGRIFGAWEEANLRNVALYDLLFKPYYVGQLICDGTEDPEIREQAANVRRVEAALRRAKPPG